MPDQAGEARTAHIESATTRVARWFDEHPVVRALDRLLKVLSIVVAVGVWVYAERQYIEEAPQRAEERHNRAWSLLTQERGVVADAGRSDAIRQLLADHVSLAGLPAESAFLNYLNLAKANLQGADFTRAALNYDDFSRSNLRGAIFTGALVNRCDFTGAIMAEDHTVDSTLHIPAHILNSTFRNVSFAGKTLDTTVVDVSDLTPEQETTVFDHTDFTGATIGAGSKIVRRSGTIEAGPDDNVFRRAVLCHTQFFKQTLGRSVEASRDCALTAAPP